MKIPDYVRPGALREALELLDEHGDEAKILAGGTALNLLLQQKLIAPQLLIDVSELPKLADVQRQFDGLHIGPLARLRQLELSDAVRSTYPGLAQCIGSVANIRIRNQATLGGNLAEADYASDPPTFLLILNASVELSSWNGTRRLDLSDFLLGMYTTALEPGELITDIIVPPLPSEYSMTYIKFKTRSSEDRPCLGVAAMLAMEEDQVVDLRLAVGAASGVPVRLPEAEALARGERLTEPRVADIADAYADGVDTLDDLRGSSWYRTQMIRTHVKRALEELTNGRR